MSPADVLKIIKEKEVKFVDLRFTDTKRQGAARHRAAQGVRRGNVRGRQRVRRLVDRRLEGHRGLRHAADAGPGTAVHRPVHRRDRRCIITLRRDRAVDGKGYERDPRSLAKRAEAYLKSTGIGDTAYFGPEPEFFIFDAVRWKVDMSGCFVQIDSEEAPWRRGQGLRGRQHRPPPAASRAATSRCRRSIRCRTSAPRCAWRSRQLGVEVEVHHHEVGGAGQCEIGTKFDTLVKRADWLQILKYIVHNVAHSYGKTATFMPKPLVGDNGSGMHVHQSVWKGGKNLFAGDGYGGLSRVRAVLHRRHHQARASALNAFTNPGPISYKRLVPGFEAPMMLAYSARNRSASMPHSVRRQPEGPPHRGALPGSDRESVPRVLGDDDGRPRRHRRTRSIPASRCDKNLYDLAPEEEASDSDRVASLDAGARGPRQGSRVP